MQPRGIEEREAPELQERGAGPDPAQHLGRAEVRIPHALALAAAVSWRLLIVGAAVYATALVLARLSVILIAAAVAILLASALWPGARRLRELGAPPSVAALTMLAAVVAILVLATWAVAPYAADDIGEIDVNVSGGVDVVQSWLTTGPLGLSEADVDAVFERIERQVRAAGNRALRGAVGGAMVALEVAAGIVLTLVLSFFFLKDGDRMWAWLLGFVPPRRRANWNKVGVEVRDVLAGFLRGTAIVSAIDAIGIGLGLYLLGVPLVIPLALLTFVGGFIPLIGATIAGFVAVMVALVSNGFWTAIAVLGVVLGVQQLEGNVLQPFIVGRSVKLHPAVVLLAVGAGAVLWGIAGALLAVPLTAALGTVLAHLRSKPGSSNQLEPDTVVDGA